MVQLDAVMAVARDYGKSGVLVYPVISIYLYNPPLTSIYLHITSQDFNYLLIGLYVYIGHLTVYNDHTHT